MRRILTLFPRVRFSLRTATIFVALAAVALAAQTVWIPYIRWRIQVRYLVRGKLSTPDPNFIMLPCADFRGYFSLSNDDHKALISNPDHTVATIIATLLIETDADRQRTIIEGLRRYLQHETWETASIPAVEGLLKFALDDSKPGQVRRQALSLWSGWVVTTGLSSADRSAFLRTADLELRKASEGSLMRPGWAYALGVLGGSDERALLLKFVDDPDAGFRRAVRRILSQTRSPDDLARIAKWVDEKDVELQDYMFPCPVVRETHEGHEILLRIAADTSRDDNFRSWAMHHLQGDGDGTARLLDVLKDPVMRDRIGRFVRTFTYDPRVPQEPDPRIRARLFQEQTDITEGVNRRYLWDQILSQLSESSLLQSGQWNYYFNKWGRPQLISEGHGIARKRAEQTRRVLQMVTGREDLRTHEEWAEWYAALPTIPQISRKSWLEAAIQCPEAVGSVVDPAWIEARSAILEDEITLYEQLVNSGSPRARFVGARSLLLRANRLDMIPVLIDLIEQESMKPPGRRSTASIELLKERFGENFLWDVAAWRSWWGRRVTDFSSVSAHTRI